MASSTTKPTAGSGAATIPSGPAHPGPDPGPSPVPDRGSEPRRNGNGNGGGDRSTSHGSEAAALIRRLLTVIGEDPDRPGLRDTPVRAARALEALTHGYRRSAAEAIGGGMFEERHDSMVLVRDIEFYSLCEHHLLPFYGRAQVAYVPDERIVGLSKIARVVDVFARRLQVQERLTDQIADALVSALAPRGVGVILEARHLCMMMRGVEKQNSQTLTSATRGSFAHCPTTRAEFHRLALD